MEPQEMTDQELEQVRKEVTAEVFEGKVREPDPEPAPEPDPEPEPEPDPQDKIKSLEEQLARMNQAVQNFDTVANRLKQAESRIGSITNELHAAKAAAEAAKELKKDEKPSPKEIAAAQTNEDWESLKKEFPEWAKGFDGRLQIERDQIKSELQEKLVELESRFPKEDKASPKIEELENQVSTLKEIIQLSSKYPDFAKTSASKEFNEWIATQPAEFQQKRASSKAVDAIEVLDKFYDSKPKQESPTDIAAKRKERLSQSQVPQGKKSAPAKSEDSMTDEEIRNQIAKEVWG